MKYAQFTREILEKYSFQVISGNLHIKSFTTPKNSVIHNRLTHSIEVVSIAESMTRQVALELIKYNKLLFNSENKHKHNPLELTSKQMFLKNISDIAKASSLVHDIGNPPFGHEG